MLLSVVCPTIRGREDELDHTIDAYERLTHFPIDWVIVHNRPTCGEAWNMGVAEAKGDVLHFTADDLEPESDAWLYAALRALVRGCVPMGWVREDDAGTFGRDFPRVPTCRRDWWRDVPDVHYWSDNAFGDLMAATGHPAVVAEGFDFYHRRSMVGRDESPERLERDRSAYLHLRP